MIILHFHPQPQFKYELFHIFFTRCLCLETIGLIVAPCKYHVLKTSTNICFKNIKFPRCVRVIFWAFLFSAELRRPEGPPSGAPYSYRKEKETHELFFPWLSWLAVLLVGAYARRRRSRATWRPYSK